MNVNENWRRSCVAYLKGNMKSFMLLYVRILAGEINAACFYEYRYFMTTTQ